MAERTASDNPQKLSIRLMGLQPGSSQDELVEALRRLYQGKDPEEIRKSLARIPFLLTRSVSEEQAQKIKRFLEAKGAILEIAYPSRVVRGQRAEPGGESPRPAGPEPGRSTGPVQPSLFPTPAGEPGPIVSGMKAREWARDRRAKPRSRPGIQLQPMGIGEILDRSFRLMQQRFGLFFFILLIPQGVAFLLGRGLQWMLTGGVSGEITLAVGLGFGVSALLTVLVFLVIFIWAQGALIHAVSETYLGHDTSVGASYGAMRSRLGTLMGTMLLMWLLVGLGTLLFIIPGMLLFLNWLMTDKAVVLEGGRGMDAMRRSRELMKTRTEPGFWRGPRMKASIILSVAILIGIGIRLLFQAPAFALLLAFPENELLLFLQDGLGMLGEALATAYASIAMILYYYDIRIRKEGFDLKMMAEKL
jgi:hypothetical protein